VSIAIKAGGCYEAIPVDDLRRDSIGYSSERPVAFALSLDGVYRWGRPEFPAPPHRPPAACRLPQDQAIDFTRKICAGSAPPTNAVFCIAISSPRTS
jgi:hypothetical protein